MAVGLSDGIDNVVRLWRSACPTALIMLSDGVDNVDVSVSQGTKSKEWCCKYSSPNVKQLFESKECNTSHIFK